MDTTLDELRYWLALYTIPRCGLTTVLTLLKTFSTPKEILLASREALLNAGASASLINYLHHPDWKSVELCLRWLEKPQRYILPWGDTRYPMLLREIPYPPLILFVTGELSVLQQRQLAIVGARYPSPTGLEIAYQFANELSERGFAITSGLARGIDGAAHQGALAANGTTIAVLGSGLDNIYPNCHQSLAQTILKKGGVLLSEFFPCSLPKAAHFPRRNRIISGLSLGVIVIEASLKSGSLITAAYALEQGREVFALPGSIRNSLSQGCHALLKEGATLIENCEDVVQGLSFLSNPISKRMVGNKALFDKSTKKLASTVKQGHEFIGHNKGQGRLLNKTDELNPAQRLDIATLDSQDIKLVECLGFETTSVDTLIARTGLRVDKLLARLLTLELQGYISVVPGGYVRK
ncbi:MAG: DNA-protecting protein DprA [Candidatus Aquirickettsiella gammari]|jgi:DNA processing protein|uniref:DNA-protecting protein DprA n=1 Tax=Candidatus Aquirickettsiella gammari TaxID=2016198 RepID=A0A370CIS1_9COXI|nr:MAG: DNA-protecting protein DprA [Candidatus Aquirickettsiella gammari]